HGPSRESPMSRAAADVVVIDRNHTVVGMMRTVLGAAGLVVASYDDLSEVTLGTAEADLVFVNVSADPSRVMELGERLGESRAHAIVVTTVTPPLVETFCPPGEPQPFAEVLARPFTPARLAAIARQHLGELDFGALHLEESKPDERDWDAFGERLLMSGEFDAPDAPETPSSKSQRRPQREPSASGRREAPQVELHPIPGLSAHEAKTVSAPVDPSPVLDIVEVNGSREQTRAAPIDVREALDEF